MAFENSWNRCVDTNTLGKNIPLSTTKPKPLSAELMDSAWPGAQAMAEDIWEDAQGSQGTSSQQWTFRHSRPHAWQQTHWEPRSSASSACLSSTCSSLGPDSLPSSGPPCFLMHQPGGCLKEASWCARRTSSCSASCQTTSTFPCHCSAHRPKVGWTPRTPGQEAASSDKACVVSNPTKIPIHRNLNKILYIHTGEYYAFVKRNKEILYLLIWQYRQDVLLSEKRLGSVV